MDDIIYDDADGDDGDDPAAPANVDADDDSARLHCLLTCAAAHILCTIFKTSHHKRVFTPIL